MEKSIGFFGYMANISKTICLKTTKKTLTYSRLTILKGGYVVLGKIPVRLWCRNAIIDYDIIYNAKI